MSQKKKLLLLFYSCMVVFYSSNAFSTITYSDCYFRKTNDPKIWDIEYTLISDGNGMASEPENQRNFTFNDIGTLNSNGRPNFGRVAYTSWKVIESSGLQINTTSGRVGIYGQRGGIVIPRGEYKIKLQMIALNDNFYPATMITSVYPSQWIYYYVGVNSNGNCRGSIGELPPIEEIDPPEPDFQLSSAFWELNAADVGELPSIDAVSDGYRATINNINNNHFCIDYVTAGIKNKEYALGVSNESLSLGGKSVFKMEGSHGSQLLYLLDLVSNDGNSAHNFTFPSGSYKYIPLSQIPSEIEKRSKMCWTPNIKLYKNATTKSGFHTDSLNFVIIPKA